MYGGCLLCPLYPLLIKIQVISPWLTFLQFTESFSKMRQKLMNICVVEIWVFSHHLGKRKKKKNKQTSKQVCWVLCKHLWYAWVRRRGVGGGGAGWKNCRHYTEINQVKEKSRHDLLRVFKSLSRCLNKWTFVYYRTATAPKNAKTQWSLMGGGWLQEN